jgi:Domain of unknown function (DUF4340)
VVEAPLTSSKTMHGRGLYIATAVLVVLGGLWYWSQHRKPSEDATKTSADTPPVILKLDEGSITHVQMSKKDSPPVALDKNSSGEWQITSPKPLRADQSAVSGLVGTVTSLNSERLVEDKASNPAQYGLGQPSLQVDLSEKDNKSQKLLIGDDTPTGGAAYAMLAGDPRVFTIASYTKTSLDKSVNDLRDKRLITVNADNISRVELIKNGSDLEFGRNKDEWQILKPKPLRANNTEVGDLVRQLTEAKMDTSADTSKAATDFAKAASVATAKVTDSSGTQQLDIRKLKDDYYAKSSAVEGMYKVDSNLGKEAVKNLDDFRNKSVFDFAFTTPNKIEIHNGSKSYFLTRGTAGEDDWWSNGKKMDAGKVNDVISKLRDLSAVSFPDSGFSNPAIELSVTSNDGKRIENVAIAKQDDSYLAQRKGEQTLYKLSASSVDDLTKAADTVE